MTLGQRRERLSGQHNTTGQVYQWQLNGSSVIRARGVGVNSDAGWRVVGTGDFNGDGRYDLLFQHTTTGQTYGWLLNGPNIIGASGVGNNSDPGWHIV